MHVKEAGHYLVAMVDRCDGCVGEEWGERSKEKGREGKAFLSRRNLNLALLRPKRERERVRKQSNLSHPHHHSEKGDRERGRAEKDKEKNVRAFCMLLTLSSQPRRHQQSWL